MQPLLSICIPTYNRAKLLKNALSALDFVHHLPFTVEVVVSDNASTDDTHDVIREAAQHLPLRHFRHAQNLGAEANVLSVLRRAKGKWCVYLADDDRLLVEDLKICIARLEATEGAVALYAPWDRWDDITQSDQGTEFSIGNDAVFNASTAIDLYLHLTRFHIFPEIGIFRSTAMQKSLIPYLRIHWAYPWAFNMLSEGSILLHSRPYYQFYIRHQNQPQIQHLGILQSMTHLDNYRGGLEASLRQALALSAPRPEDLPNLIAIGNAHIQHFMVQRFINAARLLSAHNQHRQALEFARRTSIIPQYVDLWRQYMPMATIETLANLVHMSDINEVFIAPLSSLDGIANLLGRCLLGLTIHRSYGAPTDEALLLVMSDDDNKRLQAQGYPPERILTLQALQKSLSI